MQLFNSAAAITDYWPSLHLALVKFSPIGTREGQLNAIQNIHNWSTVVYAEPNFIMHPAFVPNDPLFAEQWGLQNTGQAVGPQPPLPAPPFGSSLPPGIVDDDIDATQAWDVTKGDPNAIIAIIDTGVDYNHPDLFANIWNNPGELPDGIDNDGNGFVDDLRGWNFADRNNDPNDDFGHGTHVAGIAAAVGDNNIGVAGVAFQSKIMALRAGNPGFSSSAIVGAQQYITMMRTQYNFNIVASNNSYGGYVPFSFAQYDAIKTSTEAGIPFVVAAGNGATNNDTLPFYPAVFNLPGVISVAASDNTDTLATFTQYGQVKVHIAAPGVGILSTVPTDPAVPISDPSGYALVDGTSMASPMVAGGVGLLRSFDPTLTVAQIKDFIIRGGDFRQSYITKINSSKRFNVNNSLDLVPRNEIQGTVFLDVNGNAGFDGGENGIAGWTVYLDLDNDGVLDAGEPSAVTAANGTYLLRGVFGPGTFNVRTVIQSTFRQTFPASSAAQSVTLATKTSIVSAVNFGVQELPGQIHGRKWNDLNGDGVMDPGEPGIQGVVIYVDMNNDVKIGIGEPAAVTDQFGNYTIISVGPGTYNVREVYQPGFVQIFPDPLGTDLGANAGVVVTRGTITPDINFGNRAAFDYGDAPAPYRTLSSQNGAVHGLLQGFQLGARVDAEANGIPSVGANGDDATNVDDEDGILIGNLTRNSQQLLGVSASTGSFAAGYLQGWIDFNRDGDWSDAGEQILTDVQLTTGIFTLGFAVPNVADNLLGPTYARFRYSLQRGIGPTGSALGGEVEDYLVNILGPTPTAIDDAFTVADNSLFFENPLFVLANDLPSTSGPPGLFVGGLNTTGTLGQVQLNNNSTPSDPTDDYYEYQPPASYVGLDSFKYRVQDPNGNQSAEATVTITIAFVPRDPIAVDNTFDVLMNSLAAVNKLDVMANDLPGTGGSLRFSTQTGFDTPHGTVTVDTNLTPTVFSDDFYRYQPDPGFTGQDSFTYTVVDALNETSTGIVTVQVVPAPRTAPADAIIKFELVVLHPDFTPVNPAAPLTVGQHILVQGRVTDIRQPGDPTLDADFIGAFSAYMDLLYDRVRFQPFGPIVFSTQYNTAVSGAGGVPGLIDEIGGTFSDQTNPPGPGPKVVFTKEFVASATGTNVQFVADPADIIPPHEITAFVVDPDPVDSKVQIIPTDRVYYLAANPIFEIIGAGEGENTNLRIPVDVNLDGRVSPVDSLLVINYLNANGSDPSGSGEDGSDGWKRDVNFDGNISPIDALLIINYLNGQQPVVPAGEGEAEGEADSDSPLSPAAFSFTSQTSGASATTDSGSDGGATAATIYAASVDAVFEQTDWTKSSVTRSEDAPYTSVDSDSDEFFTSLEDGDSRRNRKRL
jgi:hypothetical protein